MAIEKSLQRVELMTQSKSKAIRDRLYSERMRFELKMKKLRALEVERIQNMNAIFNMKFKLAALQKTLIRKQAENERMKKVHFNIL